MTLVVTLSVLLGLFIGISLGALGGGGSILTVPALVYVLGVGAQHATSASLLIVGLSAVVGVVAHGRAGRVRWITGLSVGACSVVGSVVGTALNKQMNPDALLLIFALLMFLVAGLMLGRQRQSVDAPGRTSTEVRLQYAASAGSPSPQTPVSETRRGVERNDPAHRRRPVLVVFVGIVVGFLTGFLGVGGGFIVVPSLVLALGFDLADAVGTSLLIIAMSSLLAIVERGGVHGVATTILVPFVASAMVAALVGNQIAQRTPARRLNQGFVLLVLVVAGYVLVRSVLALW